MAQAPSPVNLCIHACDGQSCTRFKVLAITLVMSVHSLPTIALYWQVMGTPTASPCSGSRFRKWMPPQSLCCDQGFHYDEV
jgi:hypothetical protein